MLCDVDAAVGELPADAHIYSIFEPRSYGLPRSTQPDPINDNFAHDLYLYGTPSEILAQWKLQGYTHILVSERGRSLSTGEPPAAKQALRETLQSLELAAQTPNENTPSTAGHSRRQNTASGTLPKGLIVHV